LTRGAPEAGPAGLKVKAIKQAKPTARYYEKRRDCKYIPGNCDYLRDKRG